MTIRHELAVIRAFRKAGFGVVQPYTDTLTFRLWMQKGYYPIRGTRSIKVGTLRLFHRSQMRPLSDEEKQVIQDQRDATVRRHEAESNVIQLRRC
jgi:hypothetical protein